MDQEITKQQEGELTEALATCLCLNGSMTHKVMEFEHEKKVKVPRETKLRLMSKVKTEYSKHGTKLLTGSKFFLPIEIYMVIVAMAPFITLSLI
jgi:chorismate-pyruvate lyase